eukprot:4768939-Prymnesium_polylepis.1
MLARFALSFETVSIQNELRAVISVFGKRGSSDSTRLCMRPLFRTRTCGSVAATTNARRLVRPDVSPSAR